MMRDNAPVCPGSSGAKLYAAAGMIVESLLHFVEVAVPLLVRKAPVPGVRAVIVCAKVADFMGGAVEPGVQEWVRDRLGYLVTRDVRDGVRRGNAVRRRLAGRAGTKVAERHVGVDDGRGRADKTMVRAIAVRRR
jgi:hypothetical protein